jgi:hypothetical protein
MLTTVVRWRIEMKVYLLWHAHDLEEEEDVKLLGVYSSEQKAEEAKTRSIELPGFRELPEGFHMDCYEVDQDHWTEGFITVT